MMWEHCVWLYFHASALQNYFCDNYFIRKSSCGKCLVFGEAAIYSFEGKGDIQRFRANSKADLTVEIEQETEKKENCSLELPVDFSKEEFSTVRLDRLPILNFKKKLIDLVMAGRTIKKN